jgi:lysophospholipase L1-like esterase
MRAQMDRYGTVMHWLATTYQALVVDTQAAFDALMQHAHPMMLAWDRVHPMRTGHMMLARAFLQSVEYECE